MRGDGNDPTHKIANLFLPTLRVDFQTRFVAGVFERDESLLACKMVEDRLSLCEGRAGIAGTV